MIRGFVDGFTLLLVTHPAAQANAEVLSAKCLTKTHSCAFAFLYLSLLSLFCCAVSMLAARLPSLEKTQINKVSFNHQDQQIQMDFSTIDQWLIGSMNTFFILLGWSLIYLFWHNLQQKKQLQQQMQQAQIQQLTYQLSPHFLFNALNSCACLNF